LADALRNLLANESSYRHLKGFEIPADADEISRENHLLHLSQLKKFFQSKMFVEVTRHNPIKNLTETSAIVGASGAGFVAAMLQRILNPSDIRYASSTVALICLGVVFYTLRDRMKDWVKSAFHRKAGRYLPDFEQALVANGRKIGAIKEWFSIHSTKDLSEDVQGLRRRVPQDEIARRLPEDVICYRQVHSIAASSVLSKNALDGLYGFQQLVRVNLGRYLAQMHDPWRDLSWVTTDGKVVSVKGHRVYHFHVLVRSSTGRIAVPWEDQIFRVVVDKSGLNRIEKIG
jgi:hypothetical protein